MKACIENRSARVLNRLAIGFLLNIILVPFLIPEFGNDLAHDIMRGLVASFISVAALICLAWVFFEHPKPWHSVSAAVLMAIPGFLLFAFIFLRQQ